MIKQLGFVATALAAGLAAFGGSASATTVTVDGHPGDQSEQYGLANVQSIDALHNVNLDGGVCEIPVNVLGVQVPVQEVAQGIDVPILSPGASEADGDSPSNCASGAISDGGTAQGH
ncbi:hypothetical protein [Amycolatopsis sp. Hca4]|uniref:hypothetical protein n=1 Tax=Amycolatopsis sp. Hca4 TaxID=2742131 RepID=UPI001591014C|nr:hypothetical protein [Amycolatopsis sp. Hca4]QKV78847.1 hypothetical protein HUT10_37545 [Amycolatopsis sp. Hca4]